MKKMCFAKACHGHVGHAEVLQSKKVHEHNINQKPTTFSVAAATHVNGESE